ncbi:MAG TPA: VOC family protein [Phycisphaerales bacterium]|jgi:predicted enzyme related to lactoylglutathione lyase|nr:VOC family protein [Phycisphaerales bacterium]
MVNGIHALVYVKDAEKARAFFRDTLKWPHVDAGHGWLIFKLPPAEIAAHPSEDEADNGRSDLYLMCDDVARTIEDLKAKGVEVIRPIADHGWGLVTAIRIPGGGEMGLYQPKHPLAYELGAGGEKASRPVHKPAAKKSARGKASGKKTGKKTGKKKASGGRGR